MWKRLRFRAIKAELALNAAFTPFRSARAQRLPSPPSSLGLRVLCGEAQYTFESMVHVCVLEELKQI